MKDFGVFSLPWKIRKRIIITATDYMRKQKKERKMIDHESEAPNERAAQMGCQVKEG